MRSDLWLDDFPQLLTLSTPIITPVRLPYGSVSLDSGTGWLDRNTFCDKTDLISNFGGPLFAIRYNCSTPNASRRVPIHISMLSTYLTMRVPLSDPGAL